MSIGSIFSIVSSVASALPEAVSLLQALEKAFPTSSFDERLEKVVSVLKALESAGDSVASPVSVIEDLLKSFKPASSVSTEASAS